MGLNSTTQYTIYCDKCSEMDVLNQRDFGTINTLRDAMGYWRMNNWRIGKDTCSCPKCSQNVQKASLGVANDAKKEMSP